MERFLFKIKRASLYPHKRQGALLGTPVSAQEPERKKDGSLKADAPSDPSVSQPRSAFIPFLLQIRLCLPFGLQLLF